MLQFLNSNNIDLSDALLQGELNKVVKWCMANKLTINVDKTNYSIFRSHRKQIKINNTLHINNISLKETQVLTYLVVNLDSNLSWKMHIHKLIKVVSPLVGIISKLRHFVPKNILIMIYNSLILPHLSYCIEILGHAHKTTLTPLFILQKKIVRLINFSNRYDHSDPLFRKFGILNIFDLCKLQTCMLIFDLINKKHARNELHYFQPITHHYNTKSARNSNFFIKRVNLASTQRSIPHKGALIWNSLPIEIKNITYRAMFKKSVTKYLLNDI